MAKCHHCGSGYSLVIRYWISKKSHNYHYCNSHSFYYPVCPEVFVIEPDDIQYKWRQRNHHFTYEFYKSNTPFNHSRSPYRTFYICIPSILFSLPCLYTLFCLFLGMLYSCLPADLESSVWPASLSGCLHSTWSATLTGLSSSAFQRRYLPMPDLFISTESCQLRCLQLGLWGIWLWHRVTSFPSLHITALTCSCRKTSPLLTQEAVQVLLGNLVIFCWHRCSSHLADVPAPVVRPPRLTPKAAGCTWGYQRTLQSHPKHHHCPLFAACEAN